MLLLACWLYPEVLSLIKSVYDKSIIKVPCSKSKTVNISADGQSSPTAKPGHIMECGSTDSIYRDGSKKKWLPHCMYTK